MYVHVWNSSSSGSTHDRLIGLFPARCWTETSHATCSTHSNPFIEKEKTGKDGGEAENRY